jgi:hypothetical protein
MDIGDKVQHYGTGSIGTVIDSSYEVETTFQQCVSSGKTTKLSTGIHGKGPSPSPSSHTSPTTSRLPIRG